MTGKLAVVVPPEAVTVPGAKGVTVTFVLPQHGGRGFAIDGHAHSVRVRSSTLGVAAPCAATTTGVHPVSACVSTANPQTANNRNLLRNEAAMT